MEFKNEQELITVTFFHSRSYDNWLSQRQFRSAPIKDLILEIINTMKAPENYTCFSLKDGKVIALDRVEQFVIM